MKHAELHLERFDQSFKAYLETDPFSLDLQFDEASMIHSLAWCVREDPPPELSLMNGDIWSNLRATLDHMAWQLVLASGGVPTRDTAFPCVRSADRWDAQRVRCLAGMEQRWIDTIQRQQPFHHPGAPEDHPCSQLDHFNNVNKHRLIPPVIMTLEEIRCTVSGGTDRTLNGQIHMDQPVTDGSTLMTISSVPPGEIPDLAVTVDGSPTFRISFEDEGRVWDTAPVVDWVRSTVALFEPAFL